MGIGEGGGIGGFPYSTIRRIATFSGGAKFSWLTHKWRFSGVGSVGSHPPPGREPTEFLGKKPQSSAISVGSRPGNDHFYNQSINGGIPPKISWLTGSTP